MSLTNDQLEQAYQYFMQKGQSLAGLKDGGDDLSRMFLAPVLKYNQGGTTAELVRLAVSLLQGDDAFETWKKKTGNTEASFSDFLLEFKGNQGDPFLYENFTPAQLADLRLTWDKLTVEQKESLKLRFEHLSEEDIAVLQLPAKAAVEAAENAASDATEITTLVKEAEELRVENETKRIKAEELRAEEETKRIEAEDLRTEEETKRIEAEKLRAEDETKRIKAEDKRQTDTSTALENAKTATMDASNAADRLNLLSDNRDKIVDGYWWRWDENSEEWYNTGEIAKGNVMYAAFGIDIASGMLSMFTEPEYTGANFLIENGKLLVQI